MIRHGVTKSSTVDNQVDEIQSLYELEDCREKHERIVLANPDDYNSWNYLKRIVISGEDRIEEIRKQLDLSKKAIQENPKSYAAWFHRQFLFSRWKDEWFKEHQLCNILLQFDSRNFHCWNYCLKNGFRIKEDLHNYTSMHFQPFKEKALFIDPGDEAVWCTFEKRRIQGNDRFRGILRKYGDEIEVIFRNAFKGRIEIGDEIVELAVPTMRVLVKCIENPENTRIAVDGVQMRIEEEQIPHSVEEILKLEPDCVYPLRNKLNYVHGDEGIQIKEKLQKIDPRRRRYYEFLHESPFKIYLIKE